MRRHETDRQLVVCGTRVKIDIEVNEENVEFMSLR